MNQENNLLTYEEASRFLTVKISNLRAAVFKKQIPYLKVGRLVRFDKADLIKWLQRNKYSTDLHGSK